MHVAYSTANPGEQWKIVLPTSLLMEVLKWYHIMLGHCGIQRLYDTVRARFHADGLHEQCIATVRHCSDECQRAKDNGRQYGKLPPRNTGYSPFETVAVDLIEPWKIKVGRVSQEFNALTCIDPITYLTEEIRIKNKTSKHISEQFQNSWLSRYPSPVYCIHDRGGEFIGELFQTMLTDFGLKSKPTTANICLLVLLFIRIASVKLVTGPMQVKALNSRDIIPTSSFQGPMRSTATVSNGE